MKNCGMVATALALLMLIQAAGPTSTLSTASAGQRGKSKPRMGGYGPVVKEELYGEHTCLASGGKRAQFQLTFTADHFEMKGAGGPIPREVLETVLGAGKKAEKIEGRWDLAAGKLSLTEIRADGRPGFKDVVLRPFRTGPNSRWFTRFDVGGTQYRLRPNSETNQGGGERTGSIFSNTPFSSSMVSENRQVFTSRSPDPEES